MGQYFNTTMKYVQNPALPLEFIDNTGTTRPLISKSLKMIYLPMQMAYVISMEVNSKRWDEMHLSNDIETMSNQDLIDLQKKFYFKSLHNFLSECEQADLDPIDEIDDIAERIALEVISMNEEAEKHYNDLSNATNYISTLGVNQNPWEINANKLGKKMG